MNLSRTHLKTAIISVVALLFCASLALGQDTNQDTPTIHDTPTAVQQMERHRITSIDYDIRGITLRIVLETVVEDLRVGREFVSEAELQAFLAEQQQILLNERTLADAEVTYTAEEVDEDYYEVAVTVRTQDSWNIIALPYVRYSTDDGLLLSLRFRDYNFLGTMESLDVDLDREGERPTDFSDGEVAISADIAYPFQRFGYDWRWFIGVDWEYDLEDEESEFELDTGLDWSWGFPWLFGLDWTLSARQRYSLFLPADPDPYLLENQVQLSTRVNTPWELPGFGAVQYSPSSRLRQRYRFDGFLPAQPLDRGDYGPDFRFSHGLSAGRVDWVGNFRRGREASLSNTYQYNFYDGADIGARYGWDTIDLQAELELHETVSAFGFSSRAAGFIDAADDSQFADEVRGIRETRAGEDQLEGEYGFFTNLDLGVSVIRVRPVGEVILNVFFDTGRAGTYEDGWEDMRYGGGFELQAFPLPTRAFYIRASLGWDLEMVADDGQLRGDGRNDVFFGLNLHY